MQTSRMTHLGTLMTLFPALWSALALGALVFFIVAPGLLPALFFVAVLSGIPLCASRVHALIFPLQEGTSYIVGGAYCPWFGAHQLQVVYVTFPALEAALRLVPGLFSAWLRLWGSKVGRRVYWTPHVEILDRGLLEIGDGVIFGHRSGVSGHIISPTPDNLVLYANRVRIGEHAFIGAGSYLGPGVTVEPRALVTAGSHVRPRQTVCA